jgi:uncharacterized UBP type Zn finger protein
MRIRRNGACNRRRFDSNVVTETTADSSPLTESDKVPVNDTEEKTEKSPVMELLLEMGFEVDVANRVVEAVGDDIEAAMTMLF